uniref:Uncharacterized protein n=1 Tax=Romanomermis culicivorax TaxID=13658 RepID=A0A915LA23_ROMCU
MVDAAVRVSPNAATMDEEITFDYLEMVEKSDNKEVCIPKEKFIEQKRLYATMSTVPVCSPSQNDDRPSMSTMPVCRPSQYVDCSTMSTAPADKILHKKSYFHFEREIFFHIFDDHHQIRVLEYEYS